ncbi:hypothetical protein HC928_07540 [bacterium]|nr:hypothetical protein [bacterium]
MTIIAEPIKFNRSRNLILLLSKLPIPCFGSFFLAFTLGATWVKASYNGLNLRKEFAMCKRLSLVKRLAYGFVAGLTVGYCTSAVAQESSIQVDPYTLCANSPLNSVCQPYHLNPVALEDQPGEETFGCLLTVENTEVKGPCKYSIMPEQFVAYIEEDPELESLEGARPTRVVTVPINGIVKLLYEEDMLENRPSLLSLIPAVRVARRVFKQPEEVALISVVFPMRFASADHSAPANVAQQPQPAVVTVVVEQENGASVRSELENVTGLPSEAPPAQ